MIISLIEFLLFFGIILSMEFFIAFLFFIFVVFVIRLGTKQPDKKSFNNLQYKHYNSYDKRLDTLISADRGTQSERDLVSYLLDYGISPKAIFHDLYVKNGQYGFSQIDIVVATKVGLIVFEVKDYAGWIFGKGRQHQWTQVLDYGNQKNKFYNPILQNASHIRVLKKQSKQFKNLPFYSVIVFAGNSELRDVSFIPDKTFVIKPHRLRDVLDIIFDNQNAEYTDKHEVIQILKSAVDNGNDSDTQIRHINNIKDMLGTDRVLD